MFLVKETPYGEEYYAIWCIIILQYLHWWKIIK
jgi:hypothetical protein